MRSLSSGWSPGSPPSRRGTGCRARRRSWCRGPRSSSARTWGAEWSLVIITISGNSGRPVRDGSPSQKALMDRVLIAFENILQFWGRHGLSTFGWDYLFSQCSQSQSHLSRLSLQLGSSSLQARARAWQLGRSSSLPDHLAGVWAHGAWRMDWARKQASSAPFFLKQWGSQRENTETSVSSQLSIFKSKC